ncbi:hypothetical protein IQ268_11910 [Oculatella sp. LEGE 06141]|uniref:hypothetical protein n=1 Tax=Oculatella sp. LEGE 06141 TaxID=1828648 RepID=UPI001882CC56|nr:hypothetical protein [Oculatella sp. LEGE 06141]MBE9179268.1 hypothetical protein [Oculatella sp. LEGE 06141]
MQTKMAIDSIDPQERFSPVDWSEGLWNHWQAVRDSTLSTLEATNDAIATLTTTARQEQLTLTETAQRAIGSVAASSNQAQTVIVNLSNQANRHLADTLNSLTVATETTQQAVNETTALAMNRMTTASDLAIARLTTATEQAKTSLDGNLQRVEALSGGVTNAVQTAIAQSIQTWLEGHPMLAWFITHPLIALFLMLVLIWLGWGLLGAIAHLSERIWLMTLQAPLKVGRWMLHRVAALFQRGDRPQALPKISPNQAQEKLATLLDRLEAVKREQDELLKEVRALVMKD